MPTLPDMRLPGRFRLLVQLSGRWLTIGYKSSPSGKICRAAFAAHGKNDTAWIARPDGYLSDFIKFCDLEWLLQGKWRGRGLGKSAVSGTLIFRGSGMIENAQIGRAHARNQ